jgi:hypothetical protein
MANTVARASSAKKIPPLALAASCVDMAMHQNEITATTLAGSISPGLVFE